MLEINVGVIHLHLKMNTLTIVTVAQHSEIHVVRMDCKYLTLEKRNKNTHHCPRIPIFMFCRIPSRRRNHIHAPIQSIKALTHTQRLCCKE